MQTSRAKGLYVLYTQQCDRNYESEGRNQGSSSPEGLVPSGWPLGMGTGGHCM